MHIQTRFRRLLILFAVMATILIGQKAQAEDAAAWFDKGIELEKLDKYQEAINSYDRALEIDPKLAQVWNNKGVALGKLGRYQEALESFNKALEIDPNYAPVWHNKGVALGNLGRHQEAIESYNKALEINPNYAPTWYGKGVALGSLGRHQESIESHNKALEIDPNYAPAWANKGWALGKLGRYQEALSYIEKALEINPKLAPAWDRKGIILSKSGRFKDAEEATKRAIDLEPNNTLYLNNRGDFLFKLKQRDEAEKAYRTAIKLKETQRSYLGLAMVYIELGDELGEKELYENALEYLKNVTRLGIPAEEDRLDYYFQRGYTNAKLGNWKEAEKDFRQCEGNPKAERNLRRIKNREKVEGLSLLVLRIGGWAIAGISILGLILCRRYFIKFKKVSSKNTMVTITPTEANLLKYLIPTFLLFIAVGLLLPYITAIKGPAGIGFETKEITIRPESVLMEEIKWEPKLR